MLKPKPAGRLPVSGRAPEELTEAEEDDWFVLVPPRGCAWCGHVVDVAAVVRLRGGRYDYACESCAFKTADAGASRIIG